MRTLLHELTRQTEVGVFGKRTAAALIYADVTDKIIEMLETGSPLWARPWAAEQEKKHERHETLENFAKLTHAEIIEQGNRACYTPNSDSIHMPALAAFENRESYYSTLAHELTHWTGAKHRLARDLSTKFKSESLAMEELVAELGSAFLMAEFGVSAQPRIGHASYIKTWLKVLKSDDRAIFTAASHASEAATYLLHLTGYAVYCSNRKKAKHVVIGAEYA